MNAKLGLPLDRVDGFDKVTGRARYAAEFRVEGLAHAALVHSTVAKGRITGLDTAAAEAAPGVLTIVSHLNCPVLPYEQRDERPPVDPGAGRPLRVFQGPEVLFAGQPIAVVVAETLQQARHAAALVTVAIAADEGEHVFHDDAARPAGGEDEPEQGRGEGEAAFANAPIAVESTSRIAREQHHPIEPHATIAQWSDGKLTLYDKTQWVHNVRREMAHVFGMDADAVRVVSPYVGGAFGSALRAWPHVTIAALAARAAERPVRLELDRRELFTQVGFRPACHQTVRLGAAADGRLVAICHDAVTETSVYEDYGETITETARTTYSCDNVRTRARVVPLNTNTPTAMRAPGIVSGLHALETAMDELAEALGIDPVELRLINHADRNEDDDLPWSSKELKACYATAAERFGWSRRSPGPGSMRDGSLRVGWGMATSIYHAGRDEASVGAALLANGTAVVRTASSDMGPGTYTSMTQVAAEELGLDPSRITFEIGDTAYPEAPVHGGSITMASVGSAVRAACRAVADKLGKAAREAREGPFAGLTAEEVVVGDGVIARADGELRQPYGETLVAIGLDRVEAVGTAAPGEETERYASSAFGAVFADVRVDMEAGRVRVERLVGAYDVGRVINPKIAESQCIGGMVGGIGMALMEGVEWDERLGRPMNTNLAEYLVPTCADVRGLDVTFVPSDDRLFNPLGAKGVAEVAICGVAPAIANAVWHATGRRIRVLPITPERLLV